jgi:glucosamine--fructose-6-phosphate aminotransferase (isomerizing)
VLGAKLGLPVALAAPSLGTMYDAPAIPKGARALVVGISQSGRSPDVVGVLEAARDAGAPSVAITNDPASPLAEAADVVIDLAAGPERSVAATKTYTTSLAAVAGLAVELGRDPGARRALATVPDAVERAIALAFEDVDRLDADAIGEHLVTVGRGFNLATAMEIALKVRELTGVVGEGFSPPDLIHGPIAATGPATTALLVAPDGLVRDSVLDAGDALRGRGARTLVLGEGDDAALRLPPGLREWLSPIVAVVPGQVLALHEAARRGRAIDAPVGLTKVTETR